MRIRVVALSILMNVTFALAGHASLLFNNFGPGDTYDLGSGTPVAGQVSISFVSGVGQFLEEVDFGAYLNRGGTNSVTVSLSDDLAGHPAATALAFATFTNALSGEGSIISWVLPGGQQALADGNTYWITLDAPLGSVTWDSNTQGQSGVSRLISGIWTNTSETQGALRVIGTDAVGAPEPGTWVLLPGSLAILIAIRRTSLRGKGK